MGMTHTSDVFSGSSVFHSQNSFIDKLANTWSNHMGTSIDNRYSNTRIN